MGNVVNKAISSHRVAAMRRRSCADPESFVRGSPTLTTFFFFLFFFVFFKDPSTTISGPSSARQRNAIKWRFTGVPMMAQH